MNKKRWLEQHAELIKNLKTQGYGYSQIIDYLKTNKAMPFKLDKSLLSRYSKDYTEQQDQKQEIAQKNLKIQDQSQYIRYLEQSNKDQIQKIKEISKALLTAKAEIRPSKDQIRALEQQNKALSEQLEQVPNNESALMLKNSQIEAELAENLSIIANYKKNAEIAQNRAKYDRYIQYFLVSIILICVLVKIT